MARSAGSGSAGFRMTRARNDGLMVGRWGPAHSADGADDQGAVVAAEAEGVRQRGGRLPGPGRPVDDVQSRSRDRAPRSRPWAG